MERYNTSTVRGRAVSEFPFNADVRELVGAPADLALAAIERAAVAMLRPLRRRG